MSFLYYTKYNNLYLLKGCAHHIAGSLVYVTKRGLKHASNVSTLAPNPSNELLFLELKLNRLSIASGVLHQ